MEILRFVSVSSQTWWKSFRFFQDFFPIFQILLNFFSKMSQHFFKVRTTLLQRFLNNPSQFLQNHLEIFSQFFQNSLAGNTRKILYNFSRFIKVFLKLAQHSFQVCTTFLQCFLKNCSQFLQNHLETSSQFFQNSLVRNIGTNTIYIYVS